MDKFLQSKTGKTILIIIFVLLIIGIALYFFFISRANSSLNDEYREVVDEASGSIINYTNAEPEQGVTKLSLIGFQVFYDFGFSAKQQEIINEKVFQFFSEKYPDFTTISYIKDSFGYQDDGSISYQKSYFKVMSNTKEIFQVSLDTHDSSSELSVDITPSNL